MARSSAAVKGDREMDGSRTIVHRSLHRMLGRPGILVATVLHSTSPEPYPLTSLLSFSSSSAVHGCFLFFALVFAAPSFFR